MYNVGQRYRWNRQHGQFAYLTDTECTVTGPWHDYKNDAGQWKQGCETDSFSLKGPYRGIFANAGDLRPLAPAPATREERDVTVPA